MAIRQFLIHLRYEKKATRIKAGKMVEYHYPEGVEIDLVRDDVAGFLAQIPDDINEHSSVSVTITRSDGEMVAYHDGMDTLVGDRGWGPWKRYSEMGSSEAEPHRNQAKMYAKASLEIREREERGGH